LDGQHQYLVPFIDIDFLFNWQFFAALLWHGNPKSNISINKRDLNTAGEIFQDHYALITKDISKTALFFHQCACSFKHQ